MSDCECLPACPFFHDKMENMPSMAEMLKAKYCHEGWDECARYRVFSEFGKEAVPTNMFPNQDQLATDLLTELRAKV